MNHGPENKTIITCIGDSLTEGKDCYPSYLQKLLGTAYQVNNCGIGGATMLKKGDKPYWNQGVYKIALKSNPDIVNIMLGTNDTKPHNWIFKNDFKTDYRGMITSLNALFPVPKIFIVLPVPVFKSNFGISNSVLQEVHALLHEIAQEQNLPIIDAYTPLLSYAQHFSDGVHPDKIASETIAHAIYPTLALNGY